MKINVHSSTFLVLLLNHDVEKRNCYIIKKVDTFFFKFNFCIGLRDTWKSMKILKCHKHLMYTWYIYIYIDM